MAASTRARVPALTRGLSLSTRETVPAPTPARAATSAIVTTVPLPSHRRWSVEPVWNRFHSVCQKHKCQRSRCQWNRFHRASPLVSDLRLLQLGDPGRKTLEDVPTVGGQTYPAGGWPPLDLGHRVGRPVVQQLDEAPVEVDVEGDDVQTLGEGAAGVQVVGDLGPDRGHRLGVEAGAGGPGGGG